MSQLIQQEPRSEEQLRRKKLVIVTGFGPFEGHTEVNASWEAVRLLPSFVNFRGCQYILEKQNIPVEYEAVDKAVPKIWSQNPELVIHCGVNGAVRCIKVEKLAYNHKFNKLDYSGKRLPNASACLQCNGNETDVIACNLNIQEIVKVVGDTCLCTPSSITDNGETPVAEVSNDVGNYLCGYIYLKSLDMNRNRCLFVHVPPIDCPFSSKQTADVILKIIEECIRQVVVDNKEKCL